MKVKDKGIARALTMAVAVLAALSLGAIVPATAGGGALQVDGYSVQGNVVSVTVSNTSTSGSYGVVRVDAVLAGGATAFGLQAVSLAPGQTATVSVAFGAAVEDVTQVGVSDDPNPIG